MNKASATQPQRTPAGWWVLLDRLGSAGVGLARGDDEFGHVLSPLAGDGSFTRILLHSTPWKIIGLRAHRGRFPASAPCPAPPFPHAPVQVSVSAAGDAPRRRSRRPSRRSSPPPAARQHGPRTPRRAGARRPRPPSPRGAVRRGRPAWPHEATGVDAALPLSTPAASALAAAIHRTSASPTDDAVTAGREWGHEPHASAAPGRRPVRSRPDARWSPARRGRVRTAGRRPQLDGPGSPVARCWRPPTSTPISSAAYIVLAQGHWRSTARTPTAPSCCRLRRAGRLPSHLRKWRR